VFLYGETMDSVVPQAEPPIVSPSSAGEPPAEEYVAETIPLADGPSPESSTIRHDQPPVYGTDDDHPSPLVP
jgi:hypothetical protein